jgi:predicted Zn-dependent peptidase
MYKKTFLNNGIPLVMETVKDARSISIGICVKVGSRNESHDKNGISHFLEHMFFKGTHKRTSKDIAVEIDSLGGELNAFTSRETTTFYVKVLDEYIERALDLICDIFLHSTFPEEEIEKEKRIIYEEIKMVEDTPEDYIHDLFIKNVWGEYGLGQSVLGRTSAIERFSQEDLLRHIANYYHNKNIIVACSGNFDEFQLAEKLNSTIGSIRDGNTPEGPPCPEFNGKISVIPRDLSEVHICIGTKGIAQGSDDRYAMYLLNTILGSGISSRLFQEVREKRGLAYSINSYTISCFDTGLWAVYAGTDSKYVDEVVDIVIDQMKNLPNSLDTDEIKKAKSQLKGNLVLALETVNSKMINIARQEIYYGKYFSPDEIIQAVDSITPDEMKELSRRLVSDGPFALTVYGPVKTLKKHSI